MHHIQTLTNLNGKYVYVDNNIRPLIIALNELGFTTQCCCENLNNEGQVQILFDKSVTDEQIKELIKLVYPVYKFSIDDMHPISIRKILTDCGTEIKWSMWIDLDKYQEVEDAILYYRKNILFLRNCIIKMSSIGKDSNGKSVHIRLKNIFGINHEMNDPLSFAHRCAAALISIYKKTTCKDLPYIITISINSMQFILTNSIEEITVSGESVYTVTDHPRWRIFFDLDKLSKFKRKVIIGTRKCLQ